MDYIYLLNKNIWPEIKAIPKKIVEPNQLKENEKEEMIITLQQKNQDLQKEICMMKDQLREQNNVLKIFPKRGILMYNQE